MKQVIWLPQAKKDLERLFLFLRGKNPLAARNALRILRTAARQLERFPESGRPMDEGSERRELFSAFGSGGYVLRYRLEDDTVVIIRVWHCLEHRQGNPTDR